MPWPWRPGTSTSWTCEPHKPQVLDSEAEGRAIVINLPAGEQLQEHQVHERAWLLVTDGEIEVTDADGDRSPARPACWRSSTRTSATR